MSTTINNYVCYKCQGKFSSQKKLERHFTNKMPCDLICEICNTKSNCRKSYYNHIKKCKEAQAAQILNNNVNNIDASNKTNNSNQNNQNNVVLMNPFRLDHEYMDRPKMLNPVRGELLQMLRAENYPKAYEVIFGQIHGNVKHPEYHNIFIPSRDNRDEICIFKGTRFKMVKTEEELPDLYRFLRIEMDWVVKTTDLDPKEKDQLRWDIHANWMATNEFNDKNLKRILFNNKRVVENTMKNHVVKTNNDLIIDYLGVDPADIDEDYLVTLPY